MIPHKNQKRDPVKASEKSIDFYLDEQRKKKEILNHLLNAYDDGSREIFFCLAVNMMDNEDPDSVIEKADVKGEGLLL